MMDGDEEDMHLCLVCQVTIAGLVNYIHHKKSECPGRKGAATAVLTPTKAACLASDQNYNLLQSVKSDQNDDDIFIPVSSQSLQQGRVKTKREKSLEHPVTSHPDMDYGILGPHGADVDDEDSVESQIDEAWKTLESSINSTDTPDNHIQVTNAHNITAAGFNQELFCSGNASSQTSYSNSDLSTALNLSHNFPMNRDTINLAPSSQSDVVDNQSTQITPVQNSFNSSIPSNYDGLSTDKSPTSNNSVNINEIIPHPDNPEKETEAHYPSASEKVDDFFLSLELRSRAKAQKLEKNQTELPISNILNNLTFSSDDEDLGFNFADDVSLDGFSDDSCSNEMAVPPSSHTGGKWRPGEAPVLPQRTRGRAQTRGKWPPGETPVKKARSYNRRPKGGKWRPGMHKDNKAKSIAQPSGKEYVCNICNITFVNRFAYSCHCGSQQHKENVFGKESLERRLRGQGKDKTGLVDDAGHVLRLEGDDQGYDESRNWRGKGKGKSIRMYKPSVVPPMEDIYDGDTEDEYEPQPQQAEAVNSDVSPDKSDTTPVNTDIVTSCPEVQTDTVANSESQTDIGINSSKSQTDTVTNSPKLQTDILANFSESQTVKLTNSPESQTDIATNSTESKPNTVDGIDLTDVRDNDISHILPTPDLPAIHVCNVCDKKCHNKYVFARHLLTRFHQNRSIGQVDTISLLQKYHKYIVRLGPYQCAICRFYFNTNETFQNHLQSDRHVSNCKGLVGEICCCLCNFKSDSNAAFLEHTESEDHTTRIKKCNKICVVKESHVECRCKYCDLSMRSFTRLKHHIQIKHADGQIVKGVVKRKIGVVNKPTCAYCDRECASVSALNTHVRRRHTHEKPYRCELCGTAFADRYALETHFKTSKHLLSTIEFQQKGEQDVKQGVKTKFKTKKEPIKISPKAIRNQKDNSILADKVVKVEKLENNVDMNAVTTDDEHRVDETGRDIHTVEHSRNQSGGESKGANVEVEQVERVDNTDMAQFLTSLDDSGIAVDSKDVEICDIENDPGGEEWFPTAESANSWLFKDRAGNWNRRVSKQRLKPSKKGKNKAYKCDHCSFVADKYCELRPHYLREHSSKIKLCEPCDMVFLSQKALCLHVLSNAHQKNLNKSAENSTVVLHQCPICKKRFTDEKYCQFHTAFKHHHLNTEDDILREFKGKDLTRLRYGHLLAAVEHLDNKADVKCTECPSTIKKAGYIEHLRIHCGDTPFKCKLCPKSFISSVTLRRHLLGHFSCQENTCDVCGKDFKKLSTYQIHMDKHNREKSGEQKAYVCDVCGQSFFTRSTLAMHCRRHGEKTFVCPYDGCYWRFVFQTELKHHLMSHTKERPYLCDKCGYATTTKSRLKRHSTTHSGERKHHCEYCTYKAGNATHLRRHMRIHIGAKPYICPYCNYSCNTHENMRKHISETKKHDGLKVYPCRFCNFGTNTSKEFRQHLLKSHIDKKGSVGSLTELTGLYHKDLDPRKPLEGTKIIQAKERAPRNSKSAQKQKKVKSAHTTELEAAIAYFNGKESGVDTPEDNTKLFDVGSEMKSSRKNKKSVSSMSDPIPSVVKMLESKADNYSDISQTSIPYSDGSKFVNHDAVDSHVNYPQLMDSANEKSFHNIGQLPTMALMMNVHQTSTAATSHTGSQPLFQPHSLGGDPRRDLCPSLLHALQAPTAQDIAIDPLPRSLIPNQNFPAHQFPKTSFNESLLHNQSKYDSSRSHMYPSNQGRPISHAHSVTNRNNVDFQIPVSGVAFPSTSVERDSSIYERYAENRRRRDMPSEMESENLVIDMTYIENA